MKKILYIAMTVAALTAVSCQKEKELHPVGSRIVFSAATEFRNGLETRTLYTGQYTQTDPAFERIQWVSTDQIKILYSHGSSSSATYSIDESSIAGSGTEKKSTASISVASGSSALEWAEGSSHIFYGLYPASGGTLTAGSATGLTIPATQTVTWNADQSKYLPDMDKAYMVSYKDMSSTPNSTVDLPFTPVMNAVEFKLRLPDDRPSYTVTQVKFSASASTAIAGTYSVNITGFANDAVTWSVPNNGITSSATGILINFNNGSSSTNPAIPTSTSGNYLNFTVLTLPVAFSDPLLQIKYSDGHVLKVTLTGLSLQAGQKCIVSNSKAGHDDFTYEVSTPASQTWEGHAAHTFSNIPVTTSIKRSGAQSSYTENVTWKVQCKSPIHNAWFDGLPPDQVYSNFTLTENHNNNTFDVTFSANNSTYNDNTMTPYEAATKILQARQAVSGAYDLSTHDLSGNTIARTTANCYVVTRPGTYRIPCYYGNAIVDGQPNPSAYNPESVAAISGAWASGNTDQTQNYYLPRFYNGAGESITSPNVVADIADSHYGGVGTLTAQVTWQDAAIVTTTPTVGGSGNERYIEFTITPENIKPGNVLIQLESSQVGGSWPVIWSWHIWVTDKDLIPVGGVMPFNLGWVDADEIVNNAVSRYPDDGLTLRIAQVDNGTEVNYSGEFTLSRTGDVASINNPSSGKNPHYQWGRKDPFNENEPTVMIMKHSDSGPYSYWRGIRTNNVMLEGEKSLTWMDGPAVPLYERGSSSGRYIWTIKSGHEKYGPFTTAHKDALAQTSFTPSGATWVERMTTPTIQNYTVKSNSNGIDKPIPEIGVSTVITATIFDSSYFGQASNYSTTHNWYFIPGKTITLDQYNWLVDVKTRQAAYAALPGWNQVVVNCFINFLDNCLQANYSTPQGTGQWDLTLNGVSFPYGPHPQEVADVLITQSGVYSITDFDYVAEPVTDPYTTDAARNAGSILYNLWNSALYNENASVTKYKSVYDPCPAGFAVPTIETYLGSTWASRVGSNKEVTGLAAMPAYPQTSARINDLNVAVNNTAQSPLYTGTPATGFYWTDRPCNMEVINQNNKYSIDGYRYHTDSYILMTQTSTSTVMHYNRRAAASIRPMQDPGSSIYSSSYSSPGNVGSSIEGVTTGGSLF